MGWFAYPAEEDGKRVKTGRERILRAAGNTTSTIKFYGQPFSRKPGMLAALAELDFGNNANLRLHTEVTNVTNESMSFQLGTWADTNMDHAEVTWIAIQ